MVLHMRTVIEARLDVLGEGGIAFEGEAGGVYSMWVSKEGPELAHRASTEGKHVVSGDVTGSAEVRFGVLELWNDVSCGG